MDAGRRGISSGASGGFRNPARHGGTGIGLAIVCRLVGVMGGQTGGESGEGAGSRLWCAVRFDRAQEARPGRPCVNGLRVLLVHPPGPVRESLVEALSEWKVPVRVAAGPEEAIREAREARRMGEAVGLLLVALAEAWGDPRGVARRLRGEPAFQGASLGFLLPSASADAHVPCGEPWVAGCLEAPFTRSKLRRFLEQLADAASRFGAGSPGDEASGAALRVLLVDDDEVNRLLAAALLGRRGWTVREAANGREALAAMEAEEFYVVLMDVQMPDLDGLEATRILRERERERGGYVPVVGLTAHARKGDRELCLAAGMDGYVAKPVEAAELYGAVEKSLWRRVPRPMGATPAAIDLTPLLAGLRNGWDTVGKLSRSFETTGPQTLASLRAALDEGERAALEFAAHKLRGSANIFGAKRLCELASRVEELGRAGNLGPAASVVEDIEREMVRVLAALAAQVRGG